ncbi:MAG: polysaccharide ABC transporter ATP-binding protein [Dehalococcoidales bacterium]|nr:polysaccharide ABC transporter ATP-binding protein [Dehalococcoidales bacterium]
MSEPIIRVANLSKRYRVGAREKAYKTIRETIVEGLSAPVRNLSRLRSLTSFKNGDEEDVIWALKDVSFEVEEGMVLGIIGKNGAGKTTLLKILARITEPTGGFAEIHGRISSLLEVGTGFHPELTGRENVFLNGAVLGMRKREIERKFDDIIVFSEIGKYLDTPLKRYSSGMQVRLAFAVAAHLEPEIMLIDEVLAVGDIAFQKKCLGKMEEVARGGRTILFVSHNMGAVRSLCQSAIWLDNGQIVKKGTADEVVRAYEQNQLKLFEESSSCLRDRNPEEIKDKSFYFSRVEMLNEQGERSNHFRYNDKIVLIVELAGKPLKDKHGISYYIHNQWGQRVSIGSSGAYHGIYFDRKVRKIRIEIGPLILTSGQYSIWLRGYYGEGAEELRTDDWENACSFTLESQPFRPGRDIPSADEGVCIMGQSFKAIAIE